MTAAEQPLPSEQQAREAAAATGLVYVSDTQPGIRRVREGKAFHYLDSRGTRVKDEETLARVRSLAIPPAYEDVWICPNPRGHLQATGRDARHRKQYRYHPRWREVRDDGKHGRMLEFGRRLPQLRQRLRRDLALPGLPREKVLAVVVTLLAETLIRVGNTEYARTNKSYGLTTLRDRHVKFLRDGRAYFHFRGKSGQDQDVVVNDASLARIVRRCQQLPGQHLFQYIDDAGDHQPVDSGMVNAYLHDTMGVCAGEGFTAKDFRTWGATLRAIVVMACTEVPETGGERALNSCIVAAVKQVSSELGNTPAICRKSYINPVVFTAWRAGDLKKHSAAAVRGARQAEKMALIFLRAQLKCAAKSPRSPRTRTRVNSSPDRSRTTPRRRRRPDSRARGTTSA